MHYLPITFTFPSIYLYFRFSLLLFDDDDDDDETLLRCLKKPPSLG